MITPHNYQSGAIEKTRTALESLGKALVVMATGTGKTVVGAFAIKEFLKHGRGLFLCHNNSILEQSLLQFKAALGDEVRLGVFHGEKKHWEEVDILFASFQTLTDWKHAFFENEFYFVIVDESHHSKAVTFEDVIKYFTPKKLLALTATPDRMDQKDIRTIFGQEVVNITLEEAIAKGWLASVEYHLITDNLSHHALKKIAREVLGEGKRISLKQLNETVFIKARDEKVAETIESYGKKKTIVFCESILHAEDFVQFLPGSKVYHSELGLQENRKTMEEFRTGECQRILAVDKLNEGIDIPDAELIVFLRCTDSKTIYLQQLGRGLRKTLHKDKVTVLDFVANADRVTMIREMTEKIKYFVASDAELERNPLHIKGDGFDFIFTDEQIDLLAVLTKLQPRYVSDIPELLLEYSDKNPLPPDKVIAGTNKRLWWKCSKPECGFEWLTAGSNRVAGAGCLACVGQVASPRRNLAVLRPDLVKEYSDKNEIPATQLLPHSGKRVWWKCTVCSHEWEAICSNRAKGRGCPACAGFVITEHNNLAALYPNLAAEYSVKNPLPASKISPGSNKRVWWKCSKSECGFEWQTAPGNRAKLGNNCPACAGQRATKTKNILITHPDIAREYSERNQVPVTQVMARTDRKVWWKCLKPECGFEWQASPDHRTARNQGCPSCSKQAVTPNYNLSVVYPQLVGEYSSKNTLSVEQVTPGTNKKIWWKCSKCGSEWQAIPRIRAKMYGRCPVC